MRPLLAKPCQRALDLYSPTCSSHSSVSVWYGPSLLRKTLPSSSALEDGAGVRAALQRPAQAHLMHGLADA